MTTPEPLESVILRMNRVMDEIEKVATRLGLLH
jgi:hypothetical protein